MKAGRRLQTNARKHQMSERHKKRSLIGVLFGSTSIDQKNQGRRQAPLLSLKHRKNNRRTIYFLQSAHSSSVHLTYSYYLDFEVFNKKSSIIFLKFSLGIAPVAICGCPSIGINSRLGNEVIPKAADKSCSLSVFTL